MTTKQGDGTADVGKEGQKYFIAVSKIHSYKFVSCVPGPMLWPLPIVHVILIETLEMAGTIPLL